VDVLFESAAEAFGSGTLGVVLTGMGDDGLRGARAIDGRGGRVITESAGSCVIHGMPRCVLEAGLSTADVSLHDVARTIVSVL
jgi:two-component system chemotaxis response regulator CheB